MRVGIDTRFYSSSPTGIGTYTYELCFNLYKYFDIELVLFLNDDSPLLFDPNFYDVEKIIIKSKRFDILSLFTLRRVVDKAKLDIFHTPSFIIPFVKTKTIATIHDLIHINYEEGYSLKYKIYYDIFVKRALKKVKRIITVSNASKKEIHEWVKLNNIDVTYLAASEIFSLHTGLTDLFYQHQINKDNFILYVGNNRPNKNLKRLLFAYAKIKNKDPDFADLVMICPSDPELNEIIKENFIVENVKFVENISNEELILFYSYALFFVFPSIYEGFGLPVLEAMACGCPVTCSDIPPLKEIAGDSVLFFDPKSIKSIMESLEKIYYDHPFRENLIYPGRLQVHEFSWKKTAQETYKIYKRVLE